MPPCTASGRHGRVLRAVFLADELGVEALAVIFDDEGNKPIAPLQQDADAFSAGMFQHKSGYIVDGTTVLFMLNITLFNHSWEY